MWNWAFNFHIYELIFSSFSSDGYPRRCNFMSDRLAIRGLALKFIYNNNEQKCPSSPWLSCFSYYYYFLLLFSSLKTIGYRSLQHFKLVEM